LTKVTFLRKEYKKTYVPKGCRATLFRKMFNNLKGYERFFSNIQMDDIPEEKINIDINKNLEILQTIYEDCSDLVFRSLAIGEHIKVCIIYFDGLSNTEEINNHVITPLIKMSIEKNDEIVATLMQKLSVSKVEQISSIQQCIESISVGAPVLFIDLAETALSIGLAKWEKRAVEEPAAESVVRGPREGFTETLGINIALLRRKIRSPNLKIQAMEIGVYSRTRIAIAYMKGIAQDSLLQEVKARLERIELDAILESGYIEELMEDNPYSPFPQVMNTERPDVAVASILEGNVVVLVDGTPFVIVTPTTLSSALQAPEDYYQRSLVSTFVRWLRYGLFFITLLLPSLYVALLTYHQEMIPSTLLISIAASREAVPFPALVEAMIMEVTFEALREAGIRLPKQIGAAVSIVGALVIGDAAVQAGLVSAPMVMVVAITGISSFTIPRYSTGLGFRLLRFPLMFLAGVLGIIGIILGFIAIIVHLSSLRSFGVPYFSPIAPINRSQWKDTVVRAPWWMLDTRPHFSGTFNKYRQVPHQKPGPESDNRAE